MACSPEVTPVETVVFTPRRSCRMAVCPAAALMTVLEVHRARVGRPGFERAAVELRDGTDAAKHRAEDEPDLLGRAHLRRPTAVVQGQLRRRGDEPRGAVERSQVPAAAVLLRVEVFD